MRSIARSSSAKKCSAAPRLRSRYHATPASASSRASGWISRSARGIQSCAEAATGLRPGDHLDRARFRLLDAALDFLGPGLLHALVFLLIETVQEGSG